MKPVEFLRFLWTQLTSMRTALVLLFALMIAAVPGSLGPKILPQRPNNPVLVREWIAARPELGAVFDRLGLFDVYGSPWFASIYLLLLVSLVGCIVPRIAELFFASAFRERFEAKGRYRGYLQAIPTALILDPQAALAGAALALEMKQAGEGVE